VPAEVVVSVPARAEFLHVLRSVVASVAARLDFPYDAIEDLRIAVDEACAQLLSQGKGASQIRLRITPSAGAIDVVASADAPEVTWPPAEAERSLAWQVIEALCDRATLELDGGAPAVRFSKAVPGGEGR
jgi:serine/threonine-protein kinase RsbW